ncbi:2-hydroxychromene-2-carboxylate isomerase [Streptomyces sp. SBT349]|uniref:2-hydroxychromene-2-carboxylate isomerase n=1 Tax=Streptomyces sp. SBT349 TaxID=1580539 RepID=UPI00066D3E02|nr:DsbA family protein [Streptomyces sp. SBT349]
MAVKPPRWYFSLRSPYSWLAFRELTERYPDVAARIEWRPYWEPDPENERALSGEGTQLPYVPMSKEKHLYILQDVKRLTRARGLTIAWPIDTAPRWEVSHLPYLLAADEGKGVAYVREVYRVRWELGRDVSDPATIADVAVALGLDPDRLAGAAEDRETRERGLTALREVERDGVFGVPFFIHRRDKFWGLDRLADFAATVRAGGPPAAEPAPASAPPPALAPAGDAGHAGGCG